MFGVAAIREIRESVGRYAAGFDPSLVSGSNAELILADAIASKNMLSAIESMAAARVAECGSWQREGDRSAAHQLARKSGVPLGRAQEALTTADRLKSQPELDGALRRGELSPAQAAPISAAAKANPKAEQRLVSLAKRSSLKGLSDECERTKAAALPDEQARQNEIRRNRHVRKHTTPAGGGRLIWESTKEEIEEGYNVVRAFANRLFHKARADGRDELSGAHLSDGLLFALRAGVKAAASVKPDPGPFDGAAGEAPSTPSPDSQPDAEGAEPLVGRSTHPTCGPVGAEADSGVEPEDSGHVHDRPPASGVSGNGAGVAESEPEDSGHVHDRPAASDVPGKCGAGEARPEPENCGAGEARPEPADFRHIHDRPAASDVPENSGAGEACLPGLAPEVPDPLDLGGPAVPAKILVRVDFDTLLRGYPIDGEVCEIAGAGPIPVQAVVDLIARGGFLATVITMGQKVTGVVHQGRQVTAWQRSAMEWLHPTCSVEGCDVTVGREIDHRLRWADTKVTVLELLEWPCDHHHDLKTYKGWDFVEGVGKRPLVPPEDPRHPKNCNAPPEEEAG